MSAKRDSRKDMMATMPISVSDDAKREFASRLKEWRRTNQKTQHETSTLIGCSYGMVSKWESQVLFPRVLHLKKAIKEVTGIDVDVIVKEYSNEG